MRRTLYHFYLWAADRINDAGPLMMHEWSRPGGHYRLSLAPFPSSPGRLTVEGAGGGWGSVQETFMWENKPGPWFGGDPKQEALFSEIYLWNLLLVLYEGLLIFVLGFEACIQERQSTWIFILETISCLSERYPKTLIPSGKTVLLHWLFIWLCMSGIFN